MVDVTDDAEKIPLRERDRVRGEISKMRFRRCGEILTESAEKRRSRCGFEDELEEEGEMALQRR